MFLGVPAEGSRRAQGDSGQIKEIGVGKTEPLFVCILGACCRKWFFWETFARIKAYQKDGVNRILVFRRDNRDLLLNFDAMLLGEVVLNLYLVTLLLD